MVKIIVGQLAACMVGAGLGIGAAIIARSLYEQIKKK